MVCVCVRIKQPAAIFHPPFHTSIMSDETTMIRLEMDDERVVVYRTDERIGRKTKRNGQTD